MDDDLEFDYLFKVILVGSSGVGKSNLESRFTRNEFTQGSKATIGVDFAGKTVTVQGSRVRAQIWDTAGQERFKAVSTTYYRNSAAAMVVYDITNRKSFTDVSSWVRDLRELSEKDVILMMVGNKTDLEHLRAVSTEEGTKYAEAEGLLFMETSAKSGINVETAFLELLSRVMDQKRSTGQLVSVDTGVEGHDDKGDKSGGNSGYAAVPTASGTASGGGDLRGGVRLQVPDHGGQAPDWKKNCCS